MAWSTAYELQTVSLADALDLTLLAQDEWPARYPRAAARWAGRFALEADAPISAVALVASHLAALGTWALSRSRRWSMPTAAVTSPKSSGAVSARNAPIGRAKATRIQPTTRGFHQPRAMLASGSGSIVNVASIAGLRGVADRAAYNASKHGLVGLTRTLAAEWGGRGVRVNAVCPGWVKTEMDDVAQGAGIYVDDDITGQVPMGRFAAPDDIAAAISFLADPSRSGFVNGATLTVDGGWTADASWTSLRLAKRRTP